MKAQGSPAKSFSALLGCFFLSGAAGLIYQVAWTKSLALLFGYSAYALATVLAVFMGGLALGSALLGEKTKHVCDPIALYGWIELAVAATGALSLIGLAGVRTLYFAFYPHVSESRAGLLLLRFAGAAIVLLIPTFLMGGTLPILIRGVTLRSSELAAHVSRFYAVNTIGAVAGTLAAGFVFLPWLGLRLTVACAVLLNGIAGIVALYGARDKSAPSQSAVGSSPSSWASKTKENALSVTYSVSYLLVAFSLVGATAIAYEISWTRLLATVLGSSTYAFTLMLATFLSGIVLGSFLFAKWSIRNRSVTMELFCWTQLATAIAALLFLIFFRELPSLISPILHATHNSFGGLVLAQFLVCVLAMLPAAIIFGFNFPAVVVLITGSRGQDEHVSVSVGRAYAANTFGAIVAAISVGFFLLPKLGSFRVVAITAACNLLLATVLGLRSSLKRWPVLAIQGATLALIVFVGWSPYFYSRALASFGTVLYSSYHSERLTVDEIANTEDVIFLEDGINATIAVTRADDYVALKTNGKVDASNVDTSTQLLLGDLGAIFHPHPKRVLVIGFGGGMTVSAVARFPDVERIDCVEIEPAVLHAAPYLGRLHRRVLNDPRLHIVFDDARNFIQTAREPYDLIISEPSNPWIAGVASLYTSEFYAGLRQRLAPGGIFVQWVQAYSLQPDDLRMILATVVPHFADVSLWHSSGRDLLLLARTDGSPLNFDRSRDLWNNVGLQEDFHALQLTRPESWPVYFRWSDREVRNFATGGTFNTDDRTLLEYRAPRALLQGDLAKDLEDQITRNQHHLLPIELDQRETSAAQWASAESAVELKSEHAMEYAKALNSQEQPSAYNCLLGRAYLLQGNATDAKEFLQRSNTDSSNAYVCKFWLAIADYRTGISQLAATRMDELLSADPHNEETLRAQISFARSAKAWPQAISTQEKLIAIQPNPSANDFCELGDLNLRNGDLRAAEVPLQEGLRREPYSYLCHRDLGELQRATGRNPEAQKNLEFVIQFFPEADVKAYASLALVYLAENTPEKANEILAKGLRIFPGDALLQRMKQQTH